MEILKMNQLPSTTTIRNKLRIDLLAGQASKNYMNNSKETELVPGEENELLEWPRQSTDLTTGLPEIFKI